MRRNITPKSVYPAGSGFMALGNIFSVFSKSPEAKKASELKNFSNQMEKIIPTIDIWLEDEAERLEKQRNDDPSQPEKLPVFRGDYPLESFTPLEVTPQVLDGIAGLTLLREIAEDIEAQLLVEVGAAMPEKPLFGKASPFAHAVIRVSIDTGKPFSESRYVTLDAQQPPEKTAAPVKGPAGMN